MESLQTIAAVVFWASLAAVAYAYAGYPLLVLLLTRWFGKEPMPPRNNEPLPTVSLLIAAHDEAAVIEQRVQNALQLDYPGEKLEIVIASDGSADATADIVRRYADRGVRLFDYARRRGKAATLNATVPQLDGEIVVFSDANTRFDPHAVRRLVRWFDDPEVGVVCGRLVLTDPENGRNVDGAYWRYETLLKRCEGRLGSLIGANGAIYAMRRRLYVPAPDNTLVDDVVAPLLAKLRHGCDIVYDPDALAYEETPVTIRAEFRRRIRIAAGGFQSIATLGRLVTARHGWLAFSFFSHKVLRWIGPFFLIAMLGANALLLDRPLYRVTFAAQAAFYAVSALGMLVRGNGTIVRMLRLAGMFSSMNAALLLGFCRWLFTTQRGPWARTAR